MSAKRRDVADVGDAALEVGMKKKTPGIAMSRGQTSRLETGDKVIALSAKTQVNQSGSFSLCCHHADQKLCGSWVISWERLFPRNFSADDLCVFSSISQRILH